MSGVVSPPLLATTGIVPCSIFSTGPDIIEHYCDCIVAAKREVILLTNYWQGGKNVQRIADALRELNRRVQERNKAGETKEAGVEPKSGTATQNVQASNKIVVKLMWDRGPQVLADLFRCRKPVPPSMWESNGLPTENEIPNLSMEILNYHRPLMGTFHAKLLLVDRQVALINSNNIQDRPNVEACTRLEGDIVNSIYDHALISWGETLKPPLPCLGTPAPKEPSPSAFIQGEEGNLPIMTEERLRNLAEQARKQLADEDEETETSHLAGAGTSTPGTRLSFADVVEGLMKQHDGEGGRRTPFGSRRGSAVDTSLANAQASPQLGSSGKGVDPEKAARSAGVAWASKVLGDRHGASSAPASPSAGNPNGSAPATPRRGFPEVVDAMRKRDARTGLWAEVALDTLGLGPSSSKNVADHARKSREQSKQEHAGIAPVGAGRGVSVPRAVAEEDSLADQTTTHTAIEEQGMSKQSSPIKSSGDGSDHPADAGMDAALHSSTQNPNGNELRMASEVAAAEKGKAGHPESMSEKVSVPISTEGAPGSVGYRVKHRNSISSAKASASQRLAQITKSLDFANNSQVKGEIKADQLGRFSKSAGKTDGKKEDSSTHTSTATRSVDNTSRDAGSSANGHTGAAVPDELKEQVNGISVDEMKAQNALKDGSQPSSAAPTSATTAQGDINASADDATLAAFARGASDVLDFRPYIFHAPHQPVPMALMNRRPHGTPGHSDIRNPQDGAWLAGFRYAKHHIFIQSPTLNASPIKAAVLAAVRRKVRVELWLDLGFNDKSESMPFQGGTNEQVVTRLYRQLRREGQGNEKYLEVYWYTGKDMTRPLNAVRKQRNCHVKYAAFDGQVAILGSGNQDTQSWFHSQEINVCVDSKQIVDEWDKGLRRNQNTGIYGRVDSDGIWRGRSGVETADTGKDGEE